MQLNSTKVYSAFHPAKAPRLVNEYQLWLGRQRQVPVWLILIADDMQGVQVRLCYPLTMRAIPECLRVVLCGGHWRRYTN